MPKQEKLENEDEITYQALLKAKDAFYKFLNKKGYDGAYWDIIFNAYLVSTDLEHRLRRFTIEEEYKEKSKDEE